MRALIFALAAAFVILVLWVALANAGQVVSLRLGLGEPKNINLAQVIFGAVMAGALFVGILALIEGLTLRVENMRLRRKMRQLEEEILDLRNLALQSRDQAAAIAPPQSEEEVFLPPPYTP